MAVDDHAQAGALPCGTLLDDLIAQVTDAADPIDRVHQATCRHCQAALDAIREVWGEFQELARAAIALPEDLTEWIVRRVRALSRPSAGGVVIDGSLGATLVGERVLSRLARQAALTVPDVLVATVLGAEEDPQLPGAIVVELRLVVRFGPAIERIADTARERVDRALRVQAGVSASRVEIAIEDVVDQAP